MDCGLFDAHCFCRHSDLIEIDNAGRFLRNIVFRSHALIFATHSTVFTCYRHSHYYKVKLNP